MSDSEQTQRILAMALTEDTDVVLCRNRARTIAAALQFDRGDQVRIATAVSEIARNAFRYASDAAAEFFLVTDRSAIPAAQGMLVTVRDRGPGIADLESILAGTYQSRTGMGAGLRGSKRLIEKVDIETGPSGTTVRLRQGLPRGRFASTEDLRRVAAELARSASGNPLDELAVQNRELVASIEEINVQRTALEQVNEELKETNRGVVALYDELETVHRVGRVVASRLDLDSLLAAITDATTDLSGAEFGGYYQYLPGEGRLVCQSVSGPLGPEVELLLPIDVEQLVPAHQGDVMRFDGDAAARVSALLGFVESLGSALVCPVRDNSGDLVGVLAYGHRNAGVFTERTERILSTVAVQASVGISNARLYRNVQTANDAKAHFLAVLSHELRTPLNPVFALLTAFEEHPQLPVDLREDLHIMRRNLQLEARLIDDLLDLTRISEGKLPLRIEATDIHPLLAAVVHTCSAEIAKKKVRVELDSVAVAHTVDGDAARLQQVFWNLLNNAVKFSPEGGVVVLRTANLDPDTLSVSVSDQGHGIDPNALERVFKPFEQENRTVSARFGGLGLGLAISRGIIAAHHGHVRAESGGLDQGATFTVTLPVAVSQSGLLPVAAGGAEPATPENLRILLVDDHADTRMVMSRMLGRRGYRVVEAGSVADALARYDEQPFDLVVSDLGLPDGSGHDLMVRLQAIRQVPGIALSGYGMEADIERSREAGFDRHLTKPVDFNLLDNAIQMVRAKKGGTD